MTCAANAAKPSPRSTTLLQSVFLDMFGDPLTNSKGWPKAELQSITDAIIDCPHTTPRWTESGVLALERRTSDMASGNGMTPGMLMKLNTSNGQSAASWRLATLS